MLVSDNKILSAAFSGEQSTEGSEVVEHELSYFSLVKEFDLLLV
jgi:hypothetical protein